MDFIIKKIAALGIPGLVLVIIMAVSGLKGAAALTFALAALGGPLGMLGGLGVLGIIGLISHSFSKYGLEVVVKAVIRENLKTKSKDEIINEIEKYPISKDMKLKMIDYVNNVDA
ncbi:MAG: hypothetical protein FWC16_06695 [Defluviitaleaceae bacterium]|nr:hypothetical protein [Defluviitaleaceae bacterium]MCL2274599.1 hypothetical protein [Defluviitaleaceae bacterium]